MDGLFVGAVYVGVVWCGVSVGGGLLVGWGVMVG